ncbi:MAG: CDP-alcohol phosphatidyltransferase family protein [Dermatophilaceae bacterium]
MRRIPIGPVIGLAAVAALLVGLAALLGLGVAGWVVGLTAGLGVTGALAGGLLRQGVVTLGPADRVTLTRAVLACGVAALVADSFGRPAPVGMLIALTVPAVVLDAVDGRVARSTDTVSSLGARFDMEVDAFLILALSVHVAPRLGWWVLAIGAARYVLAVAGWVAPWLRGTVPTRRWRKGVAALQAITLTLAATEVLPVSWSRALLVVALALLALSFATQAVALWRGRSPETRTVADHWVISVLAGLLVWGALVAPATLTDLRPAAFLRVPIEGLVGAALVLVLRGRAQRWLAALVGVGLAVLGIVRLLDLGFQAALYRPFNPVTDWTYAGSAVDLLGHSVGRGWALGAALGVGLLVIGLLVLLPLAVGHVARLIDVHRPSAIRVVAALTAVWVVSAGLGLQVAPDTPIASASTASLASSEVSRVRASLHDQQVFARGLTVDPRQDAAGSDLLTGLRGKDVIVVFVESYGEVAVRDSSVVSAALDATTQQLGAAGYAGRSAWLTSPTFGGVSWLAHATLQSGLWIDSQQRYDQLVASHRFTLSDAFGRAGWRTVSVDPANHGPWPEGTSFYHFDQLYGGDDLGYRGPSFGYASPPDQYTLSAFDRLELQHPSAAGSASGSASGNPSGSPAGNPSGSPADRPAVMAQIDLISSHVPWAPLPQLVDWNTLGDGSGYSFIRAHATSQEDVWRSTAGVREAYDQSIAYSLGSIASFVQHSASDDLVLVVLGDHQPARLVSGDDASHRVPITIIARDPAVLARTDGWGWGAGIRPAPDGPVWPMDRFRDQFLSAFGPAAGAP